MSKLTEIVQYFRIHGIDTPTKQIADAIQVSKRHVRRVRSRLKNNEIHIPRILVLDIETLPMEVLVWDLFHNDRISVDNIVKDWSILCWQAKWLYDNKFYGECVTGEEAINREDKSILYTLHDLLNEADIIIAYNGKKFDLRKIKTRFIINKFKPITAYQMIDPIITARKQFSFSSNSLDEIARQLGLSRKSKTEYRLWYNSAIYGDEASLKYLFKYCKRDVLVLEEVYTIIKPWMHNHPNLGLYYVDTDKEMCPTCGSQDLVWKGNYYTSVNSYKSFQCNNCGAIGRSRFSSISKEKKKTLVTSTAR